MQGGQVRRCTGQASSRGRGAMVTASSSLDSQPGLRRASRRSSANSQVSPTSLPERPPTRKRPEGGPHTGVKCSNLSESDRTVPHCGGGYRATGERCARSLHPSSSHSPSPRVTAGSQDPNRAPAATAHRPAARPDLLVGARPSSARQVNAQLPARHRRQAIAVDLGGKISRAAMVGQHGRRGLDAGRQGRTGGGNGREGAVIAGPIHIAKHRIA